MKNIKRIIPIFLSLVILFSYSISIFASDNTEAKEQEKSSKAEIINQLSELSEKRGGKFTLLNDEEAQKAQLKFDSVKEFEEWLDNVEIKVETTNVPSLSTPSINSVTASYTADCVTDNACYLWYKGAQLAYVGTVRQRIIVDMIYNSNMKKYTFGGVRQHSSYISGFSSSGWSWTSILSENGKLDTGRTLYGRLFGYCTLSVSIEGVGAGYTWDQNYYNEWSYSAYQP